MYQYNKSYHFQIVCMRTAAVVERITTSKRVVHVTSSRHASKNSAVLYARLESESGLFGLAYVIGK